MATELDDGATAAAAGRAAEDDEDALLGLAGPAEADVLEDEALMELALEEAARGIE